MAKIVILDIFAFSVNFLGMQMKYYFVNFLFVETAAGKNFTVAPYCPNQFLMPENLLLSFSVIFNT